MRRVIFIFWIILDEFRIWSICSQYYAIYKYAYNYMDRARLYKKDIKNIITFTFLFTTTTFENIKVYIEFPTAIGFDN